jgi:hypothetical protein
MHYIESTIMNDRLPSLRDCRVLSSHDGVVRFLQQKASSSAITTPSSVLQTANALAVHNAGSDFSAPGTLGGMMIENM